MSQQSDISWTDVMDTLERYRAQAARDRTALLQAQNYPTYPTAPDWSTVTKGIDRGLVDMGATLSGCTPDMLAAYVQREWREVQG